MSVANERMTSRLIIFTQALCFNVLPQNSGT
jgi:hypothetical protein